MTGSGYPGNDELEANLLTNAFCLFSQISSLISSLITLNCYTGTAWRVIIVITKQIIVL